MKKPALDLTLPEYQKIFNILNAVVGYANKGGQPSCLFYNVTAAIILKDIYKIPARPVMGAAFIKADDHSDNVMAFAHPDVTNASSDKDHFHCWVQTERNLIDFTAPVYNDYPNTPNIKRRLMFQKPFTAMNASPFELDKAGDFYLQPNLDLTNQLLLNGTESTKFQDFANIAAEWAKSSKKVLQKIMMIGADDGEIIRLKVSNVQLDGSW